MNNEALRQTENQSKSDILYDITSFSRISLLARSAVPCSHKRVADNYTIIKRVYDFHVVQSNVSTEEYGLLKKYDFKPLEQISVAQVNDEITFLKKWSMSNNESLRNDADEIIQIRVKELKYIKASHYATKSGELNDGYKALELYLEEITKYY